MLPGATYGIGPPSPHPHLALLSWTLLGVVLTTAPLALRRACPTTAFGVILVASFAVTGSSTATAIKVAAVIFAAYSAVAYSRYRRATLHGLFLVAVVVTAAYPEATAQVPEPNTPLLVQLPTAAAGVHDAHVAGTGLPTPPNACD